MGYTHYWYQRRNFKKDEWTEFCDLVKAVIKDVQHVQGIPLAFEYDEPRKQPYVGDDYIRFNGLGDDGHETFVIEKKRPPKEEWQTKAGFNFCKTARKPYDLAVTAILAYLDTCTEGLFDVSSDGEPENWVAGVEEARRAYPKIANTVDIPRTVMEEAVWRTGVYAFRNFAPFRVAKAVDGHFYVVREKDKATCRLDEEGFKKVAKELDRIYEVQARKNGGWVKSSDVARPQTAYLNGVIARQPAGENERPPAFVRPGFIPPAPEELSNFFRG